jgi:hypothetical protein
MNIAFRRRSRLWAGAALVPATLAAMLACWSLSGAGGPSSTIPADPTSATVASASGDVADATRVVLRVRNEQATATLDDTPAAREFAAMLPLQLTLHGAMGQAKTGRLPHPIDVSGANRVVDPDVADIYYWPPSGDIGIFYDDLGQSVPPPGMVRLGSVDSGLDAIASAGNRFTVWIDWA